MSRQLALSSALSIAAMLAVAICAPQWAAWGHTYRVDSFPSLALR